MSGDGLDGVARSIDPRCPRPSSSRSSASPCSRSPSTASGAATLNRVIDAAHMSSGSGATDQLSARKILHRASAALALDEVQA